MSNEIDKRALPLGRVRRYLEPGPIVLVSSAWQGERNVMTLGWLTVMARPHGSVASSLRVPVLPSWCDAAANASLTCQPRP